MLLLGSWLLNIKNLATVNPDLDTDTSIGHASDFTCVVDVCTESLKWD
jgi:hypothetical protein